MSVQEPGQGGLAHAKYAPYRRAAPPAGLNPQEKVDLQDLIRRLRTEFNVAVLLIEHDMKLVMNVSERILVMEHGDIVEQGGHSELLEHQGHYYELYQAQFAAASHE